MINARAQNAYGVAHFAQQNHVPQVRWENVDIIGDFIKKNTRYKIIHGVTNATKYETLLTFDSTIIAPK